MARDDQAKKKSNPKEFKTLPGNQTSGTPKKKESSGEQSRNRSRSGQRAKK